jgi:MrcB-like, N-terminal domain
MTDDGMTMTTSHAGHDEVSLQGVLESVLRLQAEWSRDVTPPMRERGRQIRELGPEAIKRLITADGHAAIPDLAVRGGDGAGSRAKVPWIRVYSESRSPAPTVGWYATYLFAADGSVAYLSLNQGTTLPGFKSRPSRALRERVARARRILATEMEASPRLIAEIDLQDPSGLGGLCHRERRRVLVSCAPCA